MRFLGMYIVLYACEAWTLTVDLREKNVGLWVEMLPMVDHATYEDVWEKI